VTFDELLVQVLELLQREGRVSYRALKRRFALEDDYLEDLKAEIVKAKRLARDEAGEVLVWVGEGAREETGKRRIGESENRSETSSSLQTLDVRRQTLAPSRLEAERRQLTVMFCDLIGSTALSGQLDPEELREVVRAYQAMCAEVISRFEGHLAKYLGDGLLVYFGYPVAHEDDAQRAVRAGLGIVEAIRGQGPGVGGQEKRQDLHVRLSQPLQVRIGVHTGLVVAGEMGAGDTREPLAIVGETPNIAARLQEIAEPNTVVISAATQRLVQGFFVCQDLGPQALKGVSAPLEVYRVFDESGVRSRLEVAATTGLTPLVGREEEVGLLLQRWEQVKEGIGQVVLLSGEPGIGKSRLVQVLRERVAGGAQAWLECRCSPYYQNTALYPLIDLLQRVLRFKREESPEEKLRKLEAALEDSLTVRQSDGLNEVVPLFASLLSLPLPEGRYPPLTLTPQRQKQKTLEALLAWLLAEAARQPLPFVVEDLHWADPSTLEFLGLLVDQVPTARILTVLAFRPEFTLPWTSRSHVSQITLTRLPHKQVEVMVGKVAGGKVLLPEMVREIAIKTDGVPLFVEELTKTVVESVESMGSIGSVGSHNRAPLQSIAIPATLQDSLMARLDRLGTAKEVAQFGATLGREFSYELIQAVSPVSEVTLQQALAKLVEAEVLYQRGLAPQARYLFKHALIQDAAYHSLLKRTRQQYHQQIARVLEERSPDTKDTQPELLAHHYTEAGLLTQAVSYWQVAGQKAMQRSANTEAISHLTKGLALLRTLPITPEHIQQELVLQITSGLVLMSVKGWAAPEVEHAYTRARELCRQIGETPQLFAVLWGLWAFYTVRGDLCEAAELGHQLLRLAQHQQDSFLLIGGHYAIGVAQFFLGELVPALEHMEQCVLLHDAHQHLRSTAFYGFDAGGFGLAYYAHILWVLGYPDQALEKCQHLLTLSQGFAQPYSRMYAPFHAAVQHQLRGDGPETLEYAEATMGLSEEQGFTMEWGLGAINRGWAIAEQGRWEEGITHSCRGNEVWQSTGANLICTWRSSVLASLYWKANRNEEGLKELSDAFTMMDRNPERIFVAELYRLKGELTLQSQSASHKAQVEEAEECFWKAIEVARQQQAKSLELRAVMSLARLWQQQGKKDEARQMLTEIYNWFIEGFETADLQEAKALLEMLR